MPFMFAFVSALLVVLGAVSIRMLRTVLVDELLGLEQVEGSSRKNSVGPFTRLIDSLGKVSQGILFNLYGSE